MTGAIGPARLHVVQIVTTLGRGGAQATVLGSLPEPGSVSPGVRMTVLAGPDDPGEGTWWSAVRSGRWGPDLGRIASGGTPVGDPAGLPPAGLAGAVSVVEVPLLHRRVHPLADIGTVVWLAGWLRRHRPDVVHTHSAKAGVVGRVAAAVAGVPVVHTVHGWSFAAGDPTPSFRSLPALSARPALPSLPSRLSQPSRPSRTAGAGRRARRAMARAAGIGLERLLARLTEVLVVVTSCDADTGLRAGIGRPGQYRVIRSGIDLEVPARGAAARSAIRVAQGWDDRFVVGTVGRLAPQKDQAVLIEGFARAGLASGLLVLIGAGPQERSLRHLADGLGLGDRVRFLGHRDDAAELVGGFDLFALTSRWEGLPRALVEAAAAGVPIVATPVGGVPEVIIDGCTGTLVAPGDVDAVARAIRAVADDPDRHRCLAVAAARAVDGFSAAAMRRGLMDLWSEVAARR